MPFVVQRCRLVATVCLLSLLVACTAAARPTPQSTPARGGGGPAQDPAVSFQGKTITIVVPYSTGGSSDIMTRLFAPTFAKHLPGNPTVIVENRPGAGGFVGENWVYNAARKDGTVMLHTATIVTHQLFDPEQVQFDIGQYQWLGSITEGSVTYGSKDLGVRSLKELVSSGKHVYYGETTLASSRSLPAVLFMNLTGINYTFVGGYGSSGDMRLAVRRGELNMTSDALSGYYTAVRPLVEEGVAVTLAQMGRVQDGRLVRDPFTPDLPTWVETALEVRGDAVKSEVDFRALELMPYTRTGNFAYAYPPGVPANVVAAAREAIQRAFEDPELRQGYAKALGIELSPMDGKTTQETMEATLARFNASPDVLERTRQLARGGS
jgi:tripartite-type tricarboxylate transporter receptor subunit TctC